MFKQSRRKVLIVKVGYSETLDPRITRKTSYGDVLRTTVLLHLFKSDHVTWLVDKAAYPVLKENPFVDKILIYDSNSHFRNDLIKFDVVINLEKVPELCALCDNIDAAQHYGYRLDVETGCAEAYKDAENALALCNNEKKKRDHNRYWQEVLFEMVGSKWTGQEYVFANTNGGKNKFDIGFNFKVGEKWPSKAWPIEYWQQLERSLQQDFSISWQQGLTSVEQYVDWINSCRLIVTNDSFGLHVAIGLKKKVVCMFGPTNPRECYLYGRGEIIQNEGSQCPYMPCYWAVCRYLKGPCMSGIDPRNVGQKVIGLLKTAD